MIDPKELRIGNLLLFKDQVKEVIGIDPHSKGLYLSDDNGDFSMESPQPISLTPDWLEVWGFEKVEHWANVYQKGNDEDHMVISHQGKRFQPCVMSHGSEDDWVNYGLPIDYVHQLQNLYYALTGKELEAKP